MKKRVAFFSVGLILTIIGFGLYLNGPKRYIQFEKEKLGDWTKSITAENSREIVWYFYSKSNRYFVSNLTVIVNASTSGGTFWLHMLNESQFAVWQENETINQSLMSRYVVDRFDFVFNPEENEKYHFIAKNPSNITSYVHLSLWLEGDFLCFDYGLMPLHLFVLASGLGICLVLGKKCSPSFDDFLKNWSLPLYRPLGKAKRDKDETVLRFDLFSRFKRLTKYFIFSLLFVIILYFFYEVISAFDFLVNFQPIKPEQKLLAIDFLIRNSILRVMLMLPFLVGVPLHLLVISPRVEDLSDMLKSKLGLERRTKKRWLISKYMYQRLVQGAFSSRFLLFVVLFFLPIPFVYLYNSHVVTAAYLASCFSVLGIWAGYTMWSGFEEVCVQHGIGKFAAKRSMTSQTVGYTVMMSVGWFYVSILILFAISNFWISTIESIVFEPVALLEPFSGLISVASVQFGGFLAVLLLLVCFVLVAFLFFILFPYLHKMGPKGVIGAFVVFCLTYITECLVSLGLQGTASAVIQPLGLIGPILAAAISQIAQSKYNKIIKKRLA